MGTPTIIMFGDRKYYALFEHNVATEMAYIFNHVLDDWQRDWFLYSAGLSQEPPVSVKTYEKLIQEYGM